MAGYFAWVGRIWVAFVSLFRRAAGLSKPARIGAVGGRD